MSNDSYKPEDVKYAHERLDEHEQVHDKFDRRISKNENYRLQAQGALKILALILGAGGLAAIGEVLFGLL
jgi:hypothetical protein